MGKSFKKHPVDGHCSARSEKYDKQRDNRGYRRKEKQAINNDIDVEVKVKDGSWRFQKDGKHYFTDGRKIRK